MLTGRSLFAALSDIINSRSYMRETGGFSGRAYLIVLFAP